MLPSLFANTDKKENNIFSSHYYSSSAPHEQQLVCLPLTVTHYIRLVSSSVIETDRQPLDFNKPG